MREERDLKSHQWVRGTRGSLNALISFDVDEKASETHKNNPVADSVECEYTTMTSKATPLTKGITDSDR